MRFLLVIPLISIVLIFSLQHPPATNAWPSDDFCPWHSEKSDCLPKKIRVLTDDAMVKEETAKNVTETRQILIKSFDQIRKEDIQALRTFKTQLRAGTVSWLSSLFLFIYYLFS
jgi:hypothetical protein